MIATTRARTRQAAPAPLQRATEATAPSPAIGVEVPAGYGLLPRGKLVQPVHYVGDDGSYRPLSDDGHVPALCNQADALKLIRAHMRESAQEVAREAKRRRLDDEEAGTVGKVVEKRPARPRPPRPATPQVAATPVPTRSQVAQASLF